MTIKLTEQEKGLSSRPAQGLQYTDGQRKSRERENSNDNKKIKGRQ